MPAFEIAYIPTVPELDLDDTGSTATKAALATLKIISEQNGFIRLFYGQQVESKETTQLCIGASPCFIALSTAQRLA